MFVARGDRSGLRCTVQTMMSFDVGGNVVAAR